MLLFAKMLLFSPSIATIATGTPAGVGLGMDPPTFLKAGDEVVLEVDGLGQQRQEVGRDPA